MSTKLDIINKRATAIGKLDRRLAAIRQHSTTSPFSIGEAEYDLQQLTDWEKKFEEFHDAILAKTKEDDERLVETEAAIAIEIKLREAGSKLRNILAELNTPDDNISTGRTQQHTATADVKLPRMDLPTFSGNYTDWPSFHDLFSSIVHNNNKISKSQKLHYLKNSLQREAAELVKSIDITDANYDRAWKLLADRFDNKRQIIHAHIRSMLKQEPMKIESPSKLRKLLDTTTKHIDALAALNMDAEENWEQFMTVLVVDRLDAESRKHWELHSPGPKLPDFEELMKFLDQRARALESCGDVSQTYNSKKPSQLPARKQLNSAKFGTSTYHTSTSTKCAACQASHHTLKCPSFQKADVNERKNIIRKNNLCYNCLQSGHGVTQCSSTSTCKKCNSKHHTLIHSDRPNDPALHQTSDPAIPRVSSNPGAGVVRSVLSTAIVNVKDSSGRPFKARALLDNGSELSFVTESLVQLLGVRRKKTDLIVTGICGGVSGRSRGMVKVELGSSSSSHVVIPELFILQKLSGYVPQDYIKKDWSHLENFRLADPEFYKPGKIDILLGADVYYQLLKDKTVTFTGLPSIYDTHLGWIVSGSVNSKGGESRGMVASHVSVVDVQNQLAKFWELEEFHDAAPATPEEVECENHFATTHTRDSTGRYIVSLPFKKPQLELGGSKQQALQRLHQVERRLVRAPEHRDDYNRFMAEYLDLGHMEEIPKNEQQEKIGSCFYLPHHFVLKATSSSTKFRAVFDGSAQTTTRVALNDKLMVGPRLQRDIVDILIRFLFYRYVFTADIAKFFRQVLVKPGERDFQRIVWRDSTQAPIKEYKLSTVTYGTASAPYLASRSLLQLGVDHAEEFPLAAAVVKSDFYVDDVMTGEHSETDILELQQQLIMLLAKAVPPEERESQLPLLMESDDAVKALGLYWHPGGDYFFYKVNLDEEARIISKRTMLSDTSKLYDPLGWLAPVIIRAKILFQSLWKEKLGWDDSLPLDLKEKWLDLRRDLFNLHQLRIPRHVINNVESEFQLHGFCDASQLAYAAVIFVRSCSSSGDIKVRVICSKTKVAPVKVVSIPRLELCGAILLSRLLRRVSKTVNIPVSSVYAWTDSTVVLDWLDGLPCKWKTFVANRVSEIQETWPREKWNHVPTLDNPADCATKGLSSLELVDFSLWWSGPSWLHRSADHWPPPYRRVEQFAAFHEQRPVTVLTTQLQDRFLATTYSSIMKLQRVTAFVYRFVRNSRTGESNHVKLSSVKDVDPLTPEELDSALMYWVKRAQAESEILSSTLDSIRDPKPIPKCVMSLSPFIDPNGILRVGGRLQNTGLLYNKKHPILLPQKHHLTTLLVRSEHHRLLHGGGQLVMASLSQKYWIVNAKKVIRTCIRKCIKCYRYNSESFDQIMGNLPSSRVEPSRPFLRTGVDYGGPFLLKSAVGRGGKTHKSYMALFVCFVTKAIHIELVTDLTTEAFLAALKRFVARRGKPLEVWSDNGTNFVGANNEMMDLFRIYNSQIHNHGVADHLAMDGVKWTFIPPRAPHHGGLWEAGIKSAKLHMRKVIGDTPMTYEEMTTTLYQIEACLNSRPLCPLSSDPGDFTPLTPGHFLIGEPMRSIPEPGLMELTQNRLSRFQLVQQQMQHFWRRWHREYLTTLQQRSKWKESGLAIKEGDVVLVMEDNTPPLKWIMARVLQTHPGKDQITRVVTIKTSSGTMKREVRKLCRLPLETVEADASRLGVCLGTGIKSVC